MRERDEKLEGYKEPGILSCHYKTLLKAKKKKKYHKILKAQKNF